MKIVLVPRHHFDVTLNAQRATVAGQCPYCGSTETEPTGNGQRWLCRACDAHTDGVGPSIFLGCVPS